MSRIPSTSLRVLLRIGGGNFSLFGRLPISSHLSCAVSCSFRLTGNERDQLVRRRLAPVLLSSSKEV